MQTIGVLGAGQLGRMLALAGYPLGLRFRFLDPAPDAPAGRLAEQVTAPFDDREALRVFSKGLDLATYEFENVPVGSARFLAQLVPVYPPPQALEVAQDRLLEKRLFQSLGIPTPDFTPVESLEEAEAGLREIGLPAVLKTRRLGYDGKGQAVLERPGDLEPAWERLGGARAILEKFIPFERELSIIAGRGRDGALVFYPLVENWHRQGILRFSLAPAPDASPDLQRKAEAYGRAICERLAYVGILAIELFQVGDELWANEIAPRVHNSGHWTIDGAATSQFANHLRLGLGWLPGNPAARGVTAMINLIGQIPPPEGILALEGAHLHLYDKAPRPGRKVGHVNLCAEDFAALRGRLPRATAAIRDPELGRILEAFERVHEQRAVR